MAQFRCENLSVGYESKVVARDLNFEVNAGDYLCIVGENGCGKSTLMKTILGLLPALSGNFHFEKGLQQKEIGYLPQQTEIQRDFPATVWEIVLSGCLNQTGLRPFYTTKEKNKAKEALHKMGMLSFRKSCYRELSGGQQQRVLLARAFCATQKILLLDEPVAGLDPTACNELYTLLAHLCREDGVSIVMISHDLSGSLSQASHVLHIGPPHFFGKQNDYAQFGKANGGHPHYVSNTV